MPFLVMGPATGDPKKRANAIVDGMEEITKDNVRLAHRVGSDARAGAFRFDGPGLLYQSIWVTTYGAEVLLAGVQGIGVGTLDVLRLGESLEKPSIGAVANDALRVVSLVPTGQIAKGGRIVRIRLAGLVRGGPRSCAFTSTLKATMLSGRKMASPWFATMTDLMPHGSNVMDALLMNRFPGRYLDDVVRAAGKMGIPFRFAGHGGTIRQVAAQARKSGDPIVFTVDLFWPDGNWGGHVMTAYAGPRGVRFLDQFGDAWRLTDDGGLINTAPSVFGQAQKILKFSSSEIGSVAGRYILPEARTLAALRHVETAGRIGQLLRNMPHRPAGAFEDLKVPIYWVHPKLARYAEALARSATGRVRPLYPWETNNATKTSAVHPPETKGRSGAIVYRGRTEDSKIADFYDIQPGDTLFKVAEKIYGTPTAYIHIEAANPELRGFAPTLPLPAGALVIPKFAPVKRLN